LLVGAAAFVVVFPLFIVPTLAASLSSPGKLAPCGPHGSSFGAVLTALVYRDLRAAKEGFDADKLAAVFD
jgi:hypothetical protein